MSSTPIDFLFRFKAALEGAGFRLVSDTADPDERINGLAAEFLAVEEIYNRRYQEKLTLLDVVENNPAAYLPFLQSIGLPVSDEIRLVILRLIDGKEIREIIFHYKMPGSSTITIRLSDEMSLDPIVATRPWDALLLPQLGYVVSDTGLELGGIRPWPLPQGDQI